MDRVIRGTTPEPVPEPAAGSVPAAGPVPAAAAPEAGDVRAGLIPPPAEPPGAAPEPAAREPAARQPAARQPATPEPATREPADPEAAATTGELPLSLPAPAGPLPGFPSLPAPPATQVSGIVGQARAKRASYTSGVLSRLAADPRTAWWIRRAVISAVAGVAVTLLTDWRLGITAATAAAAGDAIFRARTSPAIPAPVRVNSARRRTRRRVSWLSPSGYLALHNRVIPGTTAVIGHLVIGPAGVFAVDSERWDRRLPVRASHGGELFHGPYSQAGRLREARWQARRVGELIGAALGEPVRVQPAMVVFGPSVPWIVVRIAGVDVFSGRRLRTYLRREAAANRASGLTDRQVELICAAAAQALPPARLPQAARRS